MLPKLLSFVRPVHHGMNGMDVIQAQTILMGFRTQLELWNF